VPEDMPPGLVPPSQVHPEHEEALLLRDAMIAGLAGAASDVAEVGRMLYKATVLSKVQRVVIYATLAFVVVCMMGLIVIAGLNRAGNSRIVDCTTPGGECYERSQTETGKLIDHLIRQNEAAAYCSPRSVKPADYQACIAGYAKGRAGGAG
jgi:hypothetical protein